MCIRDRLNPVWQIVESLTELQRSLASMERVFEVLETDIDKPDKDNARLANQDVQEIKFENVHFAYEKDSDLREAPKGQIATAAPETTESGTIDPTPPKDVVRALNLTVAGGTVVALVGRSGAGKTTITDLVARF